MANEADAAPEDDPFAQAVEEYARLRPSREAFTEKLAGLIKDVIQAAGIDVHQIEFRCKTVEGFKEKAQRRDKNYADPLREITDQVGVRVIAYYQEDVPEICKLLRGQFRVDEAHSEEKATKLAPDQFGYRSDHLVLTLGDSRRRLPEWSAFDGVAAEVQVRTVLEHAWAAIDHKLRYKSKEQVPTTQRRKLFRLIAMLEFADEQFSELREETQHLAESYQEQVDKGHLDIELNALSLTEYLRSEGRGPRLLEILRSVGIPSYADEYAAPWTEAGKEVPDEILAKAAEHRLDDDVLGSTIVYSLAGVETIAELDAILDGAEEWAMPFLSEVAKLVGTTPIMTFGPVDAAWMLTLRRKRPDLGPLADTFSVAGSIWPEIKHIIYSDDDNVSGGDRAEGGVPDEETPSAEVSEGGQAK